MNKELSKALREIIIENGGLVFVDKLFGTVQTVEKNEEGENGFPVRKRFPVATEHFVEDCHKRNEEITTPDSSLRGLIYFEDKGTRIINSRSSGTSYESSLRLICWINRNKVTAEKYEEISGLAINDVLSKLRIGKIIRQKSIFTNIKTEVDFIPAQNSAIFSAYTYDEAVTQYLRPPFEFFALDLRVSYSINGDCINEIEYNGSLC